LPSNPPPRSDSTNCAPPCPAPMTMIVSAIESVV
jgi:hypothetical protein